MSDHTIKRTRGNRGVEAPFKDADEAITPGELLEIRGNGNLGPHGTADGNVIPIVALEDPNREAAAGTKQIDVDYSSGESVRHWYAAPGEEFYMFLAAGENVAEGDYLSSDGAGALKAESVTVDPTATTAESVAAAGIKFIAAEDRDASGATTRQRILVRRV